MPRRFFWGENAIDTILKVSENVNRQFLDIANSKGYQGSQYEPWMALHSKFIKFEKFPRWQNDSLFFSLQEMREFLALIKRLNPDKETIFSLENYPIRVSSLDSDQYNYFCDKIAEAKSNLENRIPWIRPIYNGIVNKFVPIEGIYEKNENDFGMSTIWLKGLIFYDKRQERPLKLRIENLAHELAHQIIINYQLSDRLIVGDLNAPIYSAIRRTKRPAIMALHGAAALSYMFLAASTDHANDRSLIILHDLIETLKGLKEVKLTPVGQQLYLEMYELTK